MSKLDKLIDTWLSDLCPSQQEAYEERAAILEYEARLSRGKAEQEAMKEIRRKVDHDKVNK